MDYGMISQIEKARLYAEEPQRVTFKTLRASFKGDNNSYTITLDGPAWHCTCPGFATHHICPHIMAMERLLRPMLKIDPVPYAPGQNVVSDVEKATRYAEEKDRIVFEAFEVTLKGNNSDHSVAYDHGTWNCDSNSFRLRGVSSHTIAMERLLKGMLAEESPQVSR
jgi:hypothetical protein